MTALVIEVNNDCGFISQDSMQSELLMANTFSFSKEV